MTGNLPARIDRAAIERIIQRAAELQTGERDLSEGLSADEVVSLGKEVGIPEQFLKQAMLEERSRATMPAPNGVLDRTIGPGVVTAQRVVRGDPEAVEQRLIGWMEDHELLAVQRQQPGRITWEPLGGVQAAIRRSTAVFSGTRRPFMLSRASLVSATVAGLEPGFTHVALAAELRQARGAVIGGVAALGSLGVAGTVVLAVMTPFWWVALAPMPVFAAVAWGVGRQYRPLAERTQLGLERVLDHLERGTVKPGHTLPPRTGVVGVILDEVRKAIKESSSQ